MEKTELAVGRYVEITHYGTRLGRVLKIRRSKVTVVLAPYTTRGKYPGKKLRIDIRDIHGILYWKKVIPWKATI